MRRGRCGAVAVVVVSLGLVGCTGEAEPGPQTIGPESSTSASGSATSSAAATSSAPATAPKPAQTFPPEQQPIVDVYWAYYDALYALRTQTDDEVRAALLPYAASNVVEHVVGQFAGYRENGTEPSGQPIFGLLEVSVSGATSTVRECRDSSGESIIKVSTGEVLETGAPGLSARTDFAQLPSGDWQIVETYATPGGC